MIGLRQLASLLASAVVLFGSVVVPAGDQGTVAVESIGEDTTRAVADQPASLDADDIEVYDLVTSRGAPAPPASLDGGFETIRFVTDVTTSSTIAIGDRRMPVPAGSSVVVEGFSGTLDAAPGEAGIALDLTGTAKELEIEAPDVPRTKTDGGDGAAVPATNVTVDGNRISGTIEQSGSFSEVTFTIEPTPAEDSPPLLEVDGKVLPFEQTVRVSASDYVGVVAVAEGDQDHVDLQLDGFANVTILDEQYKQKFHREENIDTTNPNEKPKAAFAFDPSQPQAKESVHFRSESDDDVEIRSWEWDFGDGTSSQSRHPEHTFDSMGTYDVSLTVTDALGRTNTTTQTVDVVNSRPVVSLEWDPADPIEGASTQLIANASDRDGDIVSYDWTIPNRTDPSGGTVDHTFAEQGIHTVEVNVTDEEGAVASAQANVIVENAPPTPSFTAPDDPVARETVFFESTSSDYGDGQVVDYRWEIESVGVQDGDVAKVVFDADGTHTVRLQVRDDDGAHANVTREIDVRNAPPDANVQINPEPINPHTFTDFQADVIDDDPIERAEWTFSDGYEDEGLEIERTFASGGTYNLTLRLQDSDGAWGTETTAFYVNKAPDASLGPLHHEPTDQLAVETSELFTVSSRVDDPDSQDISLSWSVDGSAPGELNHCTHAPDGNESRMQCGWPDDGRHLIRIHARDEEGATTTARVEVLVLNQAPTMNPSVFPDVVNTGELATMEANAVDSDGHVEEIVWAVDGTNVGLGETLEHTFEHAGNHTVQVQATDDDGAVSSTTFHVDVNAKPEGTLSFSPEEPVAGENVSFVADAYDPDGDDAALTYDWDFDDGSNATGAQATHAFSSSGAYWVELSVTDEDGAQIIREQRIDVGTPSLGASLSLTPSAPQVGEEVTFTVDVKDGREIERIDWVFGDGEATTTGQGVNSVSHIYQEPRTHPLSLEIHADYDQTQRLNAPVRITGATAYDVVLEPRLPDGQCLDLESGKVDVRATNLATDTTIALDGGDVTWNTGTCSVRYTFSAGDWAIKDQLATSVHAGTAETAFNLKLPGEDPFRREVRLERADLTFRELKATSPNQASQSDEEATYNDPTRKVYVTGQVEWVDGTLARGIYLDMAADYRAPDERTGLGSGYYDGTFKIPANGTFVELVPAPVIGANPDTVGFNTGPSLVYLPGQYQVQVSATSGLQYGDAATTSFVEDPAGIFATLEE